MTLRTRELWATFEADHDVDLRYNRVGYLFLAADPATDKELRRRRGFQNDLGLRVEELDGDGLQRLLPGLVVNDITFATFTPDDGFGYPPATTAIVLDHARRCGAQLREHTSVADVLLDDGAVRGVATVTGEELACAVVVNAAGLGAPAVSASIGLHTPVVAHRQHQFLTEAVPDLPLDALPNLLDPKLDLYLRGEGQGVLLGVADPAEAGRSDTEVTWALVEPMTRQLAHRWPRLAEAKISRGWVGCYEVTPDRRAMLGTVPDIAGFICATGFSGHGFMHGLAAGETVAALATNTPPFVDVSELDPLRFDPQHGRP
jgi:sarcosine oxidase subunit beta